MWACHYEYHRIYLYKLNDDITRWSNLKGSSTYRLKCYFVSSGCISLVSSSFKSVLYSPIHHTYYIYFALDWVKIATCKVPWQSHTYVEWLWRLGMLQMESPNHLVLYLVLLIVIYHSPDLRSFIMHQFRKLLSFTNLEAKYVTREEVKPIPWAWKDGSVILRMPALLVKDQTLVSSEYPHRVAHMPLTAVPGDPMFSFDLHGWVHAHAHTHTQTYKVNLKPNQNQSSHTFCLQIFLIGYLYFRSYFFFFGDKVPRQADLKLDTWIMVANNMTQELVS